MQNATIGNAQKYRSWRLCMLNEEINKTNIRYWFPVPRLDDMLNMMVGDKVFSQLFLEVVSNDLNMPPQSMENGLQEERQRTVSMNGR